MKKIFIVEDDKNLYKELVELFRSHNYETFGIKDFNNVYEEIINVNPNLLVLDINLPYTSGFNICRDIKERTTIPILILTSRVDLSDELFSLNLGADEYLTKPVNPQRLIARCDKLLNLYEKLNDDIKIGELILDKSTYKLSYKNEYIILPQTEGEIMRTLIENYPEVVTKDDLLLSVRNTIYIDENILQVNITRLRKKLKNLGLIDIIENVRAIGYKLSEEINE